jgi:hypothetical protein
MPFRKHSTWSTTNPYNVRSVPGDIYFKEFPSVYGGGVSHVRVDNGPVDLSQDYEANDYYNITPTDSHDMYDFTSDFHTFELTTRRGRNW